MKTISVTSSRATIPLLILSVFVLLGAHGTSSAGVVQQSAYVKAALKDKPSGAQRSRRSRIEVLLDLSGYRNAAVSFDFATLMRLDTGGFRLTSGPATKFRKDFSLVSPIPARNPRRSVGSLSGGGEGFAWDASGSRYGTAMFNLAAYDGQTVTLTLDFDARTAMRRGYVNINNVLAAVTPQQSGPGAASIPEPGTAMLLVAGCLGFFLFQDERRRNRARRPRAPLAAGASRSGTI